MSESCEISLAPRIYISGFFHFVSGIIWSNFITGLKTKSFLPFRDHVKTLGLMQRTFSLRIRYVFDMFPGCVIFVTMLLKQLRNDLKLVTWHTDLVVIDLVMHNVIARTAIKQRFMKLFRFMFRSYFYGMLIRRICISETLSVPSSHAPASVKPLPFGLKT